MKRFFRLWILLLVLCVAQGLFACAFAEEWEEETEPERVIEPSPVTAFVPIRGGSAEVKAKEINGETWLLLPAFADVNTLSLTVDGEPALWQNVEETENGWMGEAVCGDKTIEVSVMRSQNLRALFLFSDDPVNQGREYLDSAPDHETFTTASMVLVDENGHVDHAGDIRKIRGRGNFTWFLDKKAYQFKLEDRADLLDTGRKEEQERTWILLADGFDGTMLHNRVTLDLGAEMGISSTGGCEHIDLYYDGDYRGLYLLTEKVEAGEGRIGVDEYDKLIEAWNGAVGQVDLESLPVGKGENRYGNEYRFIEGVIEAGTPGAGSFVLEMEHELNTLSDRCWFRLNDGSVLACQSPENATETMMRYVSERLEEARRTVQNGGVNPDNGRTLADDFDLDAFARQLLIAELSCNADTYRYASTWFVLPKGESRFQPGPLWDFDLAYRYARTGSNQKGFGVKEETGWMPEFYRCPEMVRAMKRVWANELYPALQILLGDTDGEHLKTLDSYIEEIAASRAMNAMIWDWVVYDLYEYADTMEGEYELFEQFLRQRTAWMNDAVMNAGKDRVELWCYAGYLHVEDDLALKAAPWSHAEIVDSSWEQLTDATEDEYATWQLEAFIQTETPDATVVVNGTEVSAEPQDDGTLRILFTFEDPSYRPVDYYGDDMGMVLDLDYYAARYPEVDEECGDDTQALIDYFCDVGMEEGHRGNVFFEPEDILYYNAELYGILGTDWYLYYWDFIDFGYDEGWLVNGGRGFAPEVTDAL